MRFFTLLLCILLCFCLTFPVSAQETGRIYVVGDPSEEILRIANLAASEFAAEGFSMRVIYGAEEFSREGDLLLVKNSSLPDEGYQITENAVFYADENGLLYGLRHWLKMQLCGNFSPVTNAPDTKERTLMLDCARKYFSKDFICNLIRQMSWMGMNTLELHLTEEQGIRADIWDARYFESENDYSWICGSETAYWVYDCPDPDAGKYLTTSELLEIIAVAQEYRIKIIPSFNTPGHSEYLCNVFARHMRENPDFSFVFQGKTYKTDSIACSQYSTIDIANEAACAFVRSVMLDYAKFFARYGSTDFNVCADEITLEPTWAHGSMSAYDVFTDYINETAQLLQALGYRVRAFNDFLCYKTGNIALDPEIDIVYWHTPTASAACNALNFIAQGRTVYNAVQNYTYYALRVFNTPSLSDRPSWGLDARDENNTWWSFSRATAGCVFAEWNPSKLHEYTDRTKTVLTSEQLGGSYFLIWCDYAGLATQEEIWNGEYPLLERLWAHCAKSWDWDAENYEDFAAEIQNYYEFPGFVGCDQAPLRTSCGRAWSAQRLLDLRSIAEFRALPLQAHEGAYRELLDSGCAPYGVFGRKMS